MREADEQYEDAKRFGGPVLRQDIFEDVVETYARHHPRAVAALSAPRAPPSLVYLKHMAKQAGALAADAPLGDEAEAPFAASLGRLLRGLEAPRQRRRGHDGPGLRP